MNLDKLANELFDLSRYCAKEDEAALMQASVILKRMAQEEQDAKMTEWLNKANAAIREGSV